MTVRLTQMAKRAGCAAKHPPGYLLPMLARLPRVTDARVLVGSSTVDDAAVVKLDEDRALVLTTDFFTPIVDDPYDFGAIAAANALSDVYAMGGEPIAALAVVGFPGDAPPEVLAEILRGGAEKAREAGIDVVGGHTIQSDEPIYGLAVTGIIHPSRVVTNAGGRPGDLLVLTKPLGFGIVATAAKQDRDEEGAIAEAITLMKTLNDGAARALRAVHARAATDVTGFGLLGHLRNLALASGCEATVTASAVPVLAAARRYAERGILPGGTMANARYCADFVRYDEAVSRAEQLVLCDAQTSGGLLVAVAPASLDALLAGLRAEGTPSAAVVGRLGAGVAGRITVEAASGYVTRAEHA